MARTIAKVSEKTLRIQAWLEKQAPGTELSYMKIQHETGVMMDERGKGYLRSALRRARIESSTVINKGIVLADAENSMGLITHKLKKVDRAVRRGERTHRNIQEQFFSSLPPEKQREILYLGAVFGAIRVAAENGRIVYQKKPKDGNSSLNIPLPQY